MAQAQSTQHSLDVLWPMVTAVLFQTGKVFQDPARHSSRNLIHINAQMRLLIPAALARFHGALDVIEIEIVRGRRERICEIKARRGGASADVGVSQLQAKATMARDLAACRARRAEKQREAAEAERHRNAEAGSAERGEGEAENAAEVDAGQVSAAATVDKADVAMADTSDAPKADAVESTDAAEKPERQPEASMSPPTREHGSSAPPQLDLSGTSADASKAPAGAKAAGAAPVDETPATAGLDKMDFESMFPDSAGDAATADLNFDLDFSADGSADAAGLAEGLGDAFDGVGATEATGNDTMDALLPGLESYANAADDLDLLQMPATTTTSTADAVAAPAPASAGQPTDPDAASIPPDLLPPESTSFDDLFFNSGDLELGDGVDGGEFDDALFGLGDP
ncbi:MAG: hypothetical protein M1832_004223 [Thelocarpon impressellum]|nr:MAG: hypothetical protein M1832_004223 [Thelocarpon impressellum]